MINTNSSFDSFAGEGMDKDKTFATNPAPTTTLVKDPFYGVGYYKDLSKATQLWRLGHYLRYNFATIRMASVATGIIVSDLCRRKRDIEKAGQIRTSYTGLCKISGAQAEYLSTDPFAMIPGFDHSIYLLDTFFSDNIATFKSALAECRITNYNEKEFLKMLSATKRLFKLFRDVCPVTNKIETYYSMRSDLIGMFKPVKVSDLEKSNPLGINAFLYTESNGLIFYKGPSYHEVNRVISYLSKTSGTLKTAMRACNVTDHTERDLHDVLINSGQFYKVITKECPETGRNAFWYSTNKNCSVTSQPEKPKNNG